MGHPGAAYLGVGFILVLGLFAWSGRRRRATWLLLAFVLVVAVLSLGPTAHVGGEPTVSMPGVILERAPLLHHSLPNRYPVYLWLALALIAALWIAEAPRRDRWMRYALVAVGLVVILPDLSTTPPYHGRIVAPSFFRDDTYRRYLEPGEIVLAVPHEVGDELVWQVETDMYFRLAQGYVGAYPRRAHLVRLDRALTDRPPSPDGLRSVLERRGVRTVIVADPVPDAWTALLRSVVRTEPVRVGGVTLYEVPPVV